MEIRKRLLSNTVFLSMDWFFLTLLSFLFWFVLGKTLLVPEYGIVATSVNFIILVSLFSLFGINIALQKLIPELVEKKKLNQTYSLIKLSLKIFFLILSSLTIIFIIFSQQFSTILKIPHNAFIIVTFSIFFYSFFVLLGSILYGFQRMRKYFTTNLYVSISKVVLALILILLGLHYYGPLIAFGLSYLAISFLRLSKNYFKKTLPIKSKFLFKYSIPGFISSIALTFVMYSQYIILTIVKNVEITGIFAIAFILTNLISIIPTVLISASFPVVSGLAVYRKVKQEQGHIIGLVFRYALFLVIPISVIFLLFSNFVVLSFSRAEYLNATTYFPILIPAAILFGIGNIFLYNIYAIRKPNIYRNIAVLTLILFLALALPLTNYFSALGLSYAYLISTLFFFLLNFYWIRKFLKIKFFTFDISKILISSAIVSLLIFFILKPLVFNFLSFLLFSIISLILFLLISYLIKFFRAEDMEVLLYLKDRSPQWLKTILDSALTILSKRIQK